MDERTPQLIGLQSCQKMEEAACHVVDDEARSGHYSLSMCVLKRRYCGAERRLLIRMVEDGGGEQVASSILSAVESAGSEALPALAILRAAMEPTSVFRL